VVGKGSMHGENDNSYILARKSPGLYIYGHAGINITIHKIYAVGVYEITLGIVK